MTSKERIMTTFSHQEPDQVPIFEQGIASNVASKILGRYAYTCSVGIMIMMLQNTCIEGNAILSLKRRVKI